jgi:hypothetical protein
VAYELSPPNGTLNVSAWGATQESLAGGGAGGQELGEQTVPSPRKERSPDVWQPARLCASVHAPVEAEQQAPAHGFGEQVEPRPWKAKAHPPTPVSVQAVEDGLQHAPLGQGLGSHAVPSPWNVPPAQPAASVNVQAAVALLQQAPPVHGLGEHTVAAPWKVLVQRAATVYVQEWSAAQQAPRAAHGFGEQTEKSPRPVHVVGAGMATTEHTPVELLQHAVVQAFGEQLVPTPAN